MLTFTVLVEWEILHCYRISSRSLFACLKRYLKDFLSNDESCSRKDTDKAFYKISGVLIMASVYALGPSTIEHEEQERLSFRGYTLVAGTDHFG